MSANLTTPVRSINAAGLALIKRWEAPNGMAVTVAYPDRPRDDPAVVWTIGFGHTRNVNEGMTITHDQADELLLDDLRQMEMVISAAAYSRDETTNNEFAAMVSLAFNIGVDAFLTSSVLRQHMKANTAAAANSFLLFDKMRIGGALTPNAGLLHRRQDERALYLTADVVEA